jgi:hypothetical protein
MLLFGLLPVMYLLIYVVFVPSVPEPLLGLEHHKNFLKSKLQHIKLAMCNHYKEKYFMQIESFLFSFPIVVYESELRI